MSLLRALIVDDNPLVLETLSQVVLTMGFEALTEEDGRAAVRRARSEKPDLILIDMRLPGIDGLDAVRRMRRHADLSLTPIVALTGYSHAVCEDDVLEAGCNAFVPKPFELAALRRTIREVLPSTKAPLCESH